MMLFMIMIMIIVNTWQVRRSSTSAFLIQVYETIRQDIAKDKVRRQQMENAMDIPVTDTPSAGASVTGIDVDTILTGESSDEWSSVDVAVRDRPNKTTTTRKQQSAAAESKWSDSSDSDSSGNSVTDKISPRTLHPTAAVAPLSECDYEHAENLAGKYVIVHISEASGSTLRGYAVALTTLQAFHTLTVCM